MSISRLEQEKFFDTAGLTGDLKNHAVRGGKNVIIGRVVTQVMQFAATVALARLLTPGDYGMFTGIMAVAGLLLLFADLGLDLPTIQREDIRHEQVSNLFWINVGLGVLSMFLTMGLAPVIAWFYHDGGLVWPTVALSLGFVLVGLGVQHRAILERGMRFGTLAGINIGRVAFGLSVAIVAAWLGWGVWALILQWVSGYAFEVAALWLCCSWRPSRPRRSVEMTGILAVGGNYTVFTVADHFAKNLDSMLIKRLFGSAWLGLYNRAYSLMLLPITQLNHPMLAVAVPTLSRLQAEPERYERYYLKALSLLTFFTAPLGMFMIITSHEMVGVVLGEQWEQAGRILAIFGVSAMLVPVLNSTGWLFVSTGNTGGLLRWGLFSSAFQMVAFVVGLPFGASGVAAAHSIAMAIQTLPCLWYVSRLAPVSLRGIGWVLGRAALRTGLTAIAILAIRAAIPALTGGVGGLLTTFLVMSACYLIVTCLLARGLDPLRELHALIRIAKRSS